MKREKKLAICLSTVLLLGMAANSFAQNKNESAQKQAFLVNPSEAKTFVNPLPLDYQRSSARNKGEVPENAFAMGQRIASGMVGNPIFGRFVPMFRGTGTYLSENDTRASADPTAMYYKDKWYLYGTNSSLWVSEDFVNWRFVQLKDQDGKSLNFTAPVVAKRTDKNGKDHFYLAWNSSHIYEAMSPEGPFIDRGDFTYKGKSFKDNTKDGFIIADHNDVALFVDDDNRMYLYWGMGPYISGAELNVENPSELITEPKIIIRYDNNYKWQNFGQDHQDYENGFPEGAFMLKYNGKYYLTWATSGTQYDSYTMGCYQSTTGPLDGFKIQEKEIINGVDATTGVVRGGGHGSIVEGPNKTLWCFYTVNVGYEGDMERRLGCDPAYIDKEGNLLVPHLSEYPQYVPGTLSNPAMGNEVGDDVLSARQGYSISSYSEGRHPSYAIDENNNTWWQPAANDKQPWMIVSLKGNYLIDAFRIWTKEINKDRKSVLTHKCVMDFKLEVYNGEKDPQVDNAGWTTVYESKKNDLVTSYIKLDKPVKGQFVKLTFTSWDDAIYPSLAEFTVFGNSVAKPAKRN